MCPRPSFGLADVPQESISAATRRGDGWTLNKHLAEHQRLNSAVKLSDQSRRLVIRHRPPRAVLSLIGAALVVVGFGVASALEILPRHDAWNPVHYVAVGLGVAATAALFLAGLSRNVVVLTNKGLIATKRPVGTTAKVSATLQNIRRFKVEKSLNGQTTRYHLKLLTRSDGKHTIVPQIKLKRDAYLMAMLLIERVKERRADLS